MLTKGELHAKRELEPKWAKLVYEGSGSRRCARRYDAFFAETQELVTGEVRLTLQAGAPVVTGRRSQHALYAEALASYGTGETFPRRRRRGSCRSRRWRRSCWPRAGAGASVPA